MKLSVKILDFFGNFKLFLNIIYLKFNVVMFLVLINVYCNYLKIMKYFIYVVCDLLVLGVFVF